MHKKHSSHLFTTRKYLYSCVNKLLSALLLGCLAVFVQRSESVSNNNCSLLRLVQTSGVRDDVTDSGRNDTQSVLQRDIILR